MIKYVWFDLEETLTVRNAEFQKVWNTLRYKTYSEATNKPVTPELMEEYEQKIKQHGSNSAVFVSLGLPSDHWHKHYATLDKKKHYRPDDKITATLQELKQRMPISLFTNVKKEETLKILGAVGLPTEWFTNILTGDDIPTRKPSLDGFKEMIKRSELGADELIYVGDRVNVDIVPAKRVGMHTCLVGSTSPEAEYSFEKFEDILTIFYSKPR